MTVKLIVAVDRANAIGHTDGRLSWHLSADLKRFKALTTGSTVVMGRRTFDSLKLPNGLPNRTNWVVTHDAAKRKHAEVDEPGFFYNKQDALYTFVQVHQACLGCTPPDLWIIGGASIYNQAIEQRLVDEVYLTAVDVDSGADVSLNFELFNWKLFIQQQAELGIQWSLMELGMPQQEGDLTFTYVALRKCK